MITVSLCMIVKNEEDTLARCLESVGEAADEIIIVDTGSQDNTKEVAAKFTDKIFDFPWIDDFSAARNFSFSKAAMDYILWLDADDILLPRDRDALVALKRTLPADTDAVMMRYNTEFDPQGNVTFSYFRERLSKRSRNFQWREPVHEYLQTEGNVINAEICVTHGVSGAKGQSRRNLDIYEGRLARGETLSARGLYYYARELKDNGEYQKAARRFGEFLDGGQGWVEDNITACGELATCLLWLNDAPGALLAMLRSFAYDTPRAEICCQIGYYYKERQDWQRALFWFRTAFTLEKPTQGWGFIRHACWRYIPALECSVCYDRLGQYETAAVFNEIAGQLQPASQAVAANKSYFATRRKTPAKPEKQEDTHNGQSDALL